MTETAAPAFSDATATDTAPVETPAVNETPQVAAVEYEFIRMPDGSVIPVPKSAIVNAGPVTQVSEHVNVPTAPEPEELYYVWLADLTKRTVKASDLPGPAGTNAPFGVWKESGKTYVIANVIPVEHPRS